MNAREEIIAELEAAPDVVVEQVHGFMRSLKNAGDKPGNGEPGLPDFLGRQKTIFGQRVLADSQGILNELRADRA